MRVLLILFVCIAFAYSQTPSLCIAPRTWESRVFIFELKRGYEVRARLSYDARMERVRMIEEVESFKNTTTRETFDILFLHEENREYRYNIDTKMCEVRPLTRPFRPFEINSNDTFYGEYTIGSKGEPGEGVIVQEWGRYNKTTEEVAVGVWTLEGCIPVSFYYNSTATGPVQQNFYDVTLGLADPEVFVPPAACTQQIKASHPYRQRP